MDLLPVGGAQPQKLPVDQFPEGLFDGPAGKKPHAAGGGGAEKTHRNPAGGDSGSLNKLPGTGCSAMQVLKEPGDGAHHGNIGCQGEPLAEHISGNVFFAFFDCADQSFVDHHNIPRNFS